MGILIGIVILTVAITAVWKVTRFPDSSKESEPKKKLTEEELWNTFDI